ncbi:MAG: TolC family protein [Myxococcota bacterium]
MSSHHPAMRIALLFIMATGAVTWGFAPSFAQDAGAPVAELTEEELIARAMGYAASVEAEQAKVTQAEWSSFRAKYGWAPKVQVDALFTMVPANTDPNDITQNFGQYRTLDVGPFLRQTITILVPVYTFGKLARAKDLAHINSAVAAQGLEKAKRELELQVRRAYYGLQLARAFDAMLQDGTVLVSSQLKEMNEAREFGEADFEIEDLRKLEIFSAELDSRALDNDKLIRLALAGLTYLTGESYAPEQVPVLPQGEAPEALAALEVYEAAARGQRPEILQLEQAVRARELQLRLERASYYPDIFVAATGALGLSTEQIALQPVCVVDPSTAQCASSAGLGMSANGETLGASPYLDPYNQVLFGAFVGLRWQLDAAQTYGRVQETKAALERTRAQQAQALGAIELELEQLYVDAKNARARIEINRRRLKAAERWRNSLGLRSGMSSRSVDVSEAIEPLRAYYEARILFLQAIHDYRAARAALASSVGVTNLEQVEGRAGTVRIE